MHKHVTLSRSAQSHSIEDMDTFDCFQFDSICCPLRGGSRISRRGKRGPVLGDVDLRCGRFSLKMYVKTKELGPVCGGVGRKILYVDPSMSLPVGK